jgi:hypothetical protein
VLNTSTPLHQNHLPQHPELVSDRRVGEVHLVPVEVPRDLQVIGGIAESGAHQSDQAPDGQEKLERRHGRKKKQQQSFYFFLSPFLTQQRTEELCRG